MKKVMVIILTLPLFVIFMGCSAKDAYLQAMRDYGVPEQYAVQAANTLERSGDFDGVSYTDSYEAAAKVARSMGFLPKPMSDKSSPPASPTISPPDEDVAKFEAILQYPFFGGTDRNGYKVIETYVASASNISKIPSRDIIERYIHYVMDRYEKDSVLIFESEDLLLAYESARALRYR